MAGVDEPSHADSEHVPVDSSVDNMVDGPVPSLERWPQSVETEGQATSPKEPATH